MPEFNAIQVVCKERSTNLTRQIDVAKIEPSPLLHLPGQSLFWRRFTITAQVMKTDDPKTLRAFCFMNGTPIVWRSDFMQFKGAVSAMIKVINTNISELRMKRNLLLKNELTYMAEWTMGRPTWMDARLDLELSIAHERNTLEDFMVVNHYFEKVLREEPPDANQSLLGEIPAILPKIMEELDKKE